MEFFSNFPAVSYSFGNNLTPVAFQNLSVYIDLIDRLKDNISFYRYYDIQEGDRPDSVSYKLYGTTDYYWVLFLMNDNLRETGWPLSNENLVTKVMRDNPHRVLTTRADLSTIMKVNQTVTGSTSGAIGIIVHRHLDLGQLHIQTTSGKFISGEVINSDVENEFESLTVVSAVDEYNSVHHYENGGGNWVDINPYTDPPALYTPITILDYYKSINDAQKRIKVIKPDAISDIVIQYQSELT